MADPVYFCYQCDRQVRSSGSDLKCSRCQGEFIEEIDVPYIVMANGRPVRAMMAANPRRPFNEGSFVTFPFGQTDEHAERGRVGVFTGIMHDDQEDMHDHDSHNDSLEESLEERQARMEAEIEAQMVERANRLRASQANWATRQAQRLHRPLPQDQRLPRPGNMGVAASRFIQDFFAGLGVPAQPNFQIQLTIGGEGGAATRVISGGIGTEAEQQQMDQIITNLLNAFEGNTPAEGLTGEEVARVPRIKVEQKHVDNETQCTTCFEPFRKDETVLELNCQHIFHENCLTPWLERHRTCPICRQDIDPTRFANANAQPTPAHRDLQNDIDLD